MNIKKWEVAALNKERAAKIAETYSIPFFLAMLLDIRGITDGGDIDELLYSDAPLSDPFLMKDMDKAVARIRRAVDNFEKIAVYGDYDADGVTSTSILFTYLETLGADVIYYIPQREGEGYGMNLGAVETLKNEGVSLIITVDNGISSVREVAYAKELGMDVVVTDHHRPQEVIPDAAAVIDAYQPDCGCPFRDFSGAGVVLKLLIALEDGDQDSILSEYADLAALGTIGDVVPILGENRAIVKAGLAMLSRGGRVGVDALVATCSSGGKAATATSLAFTVIPRINATGRMGAPERAVRLLTCEYEEEAAALAAEICADNEERRRVEAEIAAEAVSKIESDPSIAFDRVIVVSGRDWHHGVIGIVASRITDRFGKPCLVISEDGESAKGSGRSVEGFSLFEAVSACGEVLERFGGHPMAAGITLKASRIEEFRKRINLYARQACAEMPAQSLKLDCKLNPASLNPEMPANLQLLEPFGSGNPQPLFGLFGMELVEIVPVGGGGHLRLVCRRNGASVTCMKFGTRAEEFPFGPGSVIDLAVSLDLREFRGTPQLTINVRDVKLSGLELGGCIHSYRVYEKYKRGEPLASEEAALLTPDRNDLAALYRLLLSQKGGLLGIQPLLRTLGERFSLGKLLVSMEILEERGLAGFELSGESVRIQVPEMNGKVDIFASPVFARLGTLAG